jgi:hypothetical protein
MPICTSATSPEGGRKRHLEARMHQRFRRHHQHDHGGNRQRAEGDGAAVDHDRDQHHRRHEERALGRDFRTRQQQIERRRGKRGRRRPFLDRCADGEPRDQREQRADGEEHHTRDDRHVVARDRQHVPEAGDEHCVVDRRRDRIAPAGEQRSRNGALVAVEAAADARVDGVAQSLHEGGIAQGEATAIFRLGGLDRPHHKAGRGDGLEKQVAREIIGARPRRGERGQQPRLQLDKAADIGRGAFLDREPHALELA